MKRMPLYGDLYSLKGVLIMRTFGRKIIHGLDMALGWVLGWLMTFYTWGVFLHGYLTGLFDCLFECLFGWPNRMERVLGEKKDW